MGKGTRDASETREGASWQGDTGTRGSFSNGSVLVGCRGYGPRRGRLVGVRV